MPLVMPDAENQYLRSNESTQWSGVLRDEGASLPATSYGGRTAQICLLCDVRADGFLQPLHLVPHHTFAADIASI